MGDHRDEVALQLVDNPELLVDALELIQSHPECVVGGAQFLGAFGHPIFQRVGERLDLGEALGVLQGSAGHRRHELGQPNLVFSEQPADMAVCDVQAGDRAASHPHGSNER